jgi:D-alanyl-D-alanine carboxypeptidase
LPEVTLRGAARRLRLRRRRTVLAVTLLGTLVAGTFVAVALTTPGLVIPWNVCAERPPLVTRHGVTLQPLAMRAFRHAERLAGRRIEVVQSYRSCADQEDACSNICGNPEGCPGRCAPPGLSWHQLGAAVDVTQSMLDRPPVVAALEDAGWCESVPDTDPGHFSFGGCH